MPDPTCAACGTHGPHPRHTVREMMFGTREAFEYAECVACGCLQLLDVPADLGSHYPEGYYSFAGARADAVTRALKRLRLRHGLGWSSPGGAALVRRFGPSPIGRWLGPLGLAPGSAILDVGCGAGDLLHELRDAGFMRLTGADPFVAGDTERRGVRVLRREIAAVEGAFDLVMMHHTFEHLPAPAAVLAHAERLLAPGGRVVLRLPVADSVAWREYGPDWVQMDAPRHLFLHTARSLAHLAGRAGLRVVETQHDSSAFQFWASEQYRRDIPLSDPRSYAVSPEASPFSPDDIAAFERRADEVNRACAGDQVAVVLERAG